MSNKTAEVAAVADTGSEMAAPDAFDPAVLRISQDFIGLAGVEKVLSVVPVRRPKRQEFVRVHPGEDYRLVTAVVEDDEERGTYLVAPHLREELGAEVLLVTLFTAITRQGVLFLWPCKIPGADGRKNHWHESAL